MSATPVATPARNGGNAAAEPAEAAPPPAGSGGFKAWLPLVVTILTMPVLAYVTATFLIVPKLQKAANTAVPGEAAASGEEPAGKEASHETQTPGVPTRVNYPFGKVLVNVSGSGGTRYLLTSMTLSGVDPNFHTRIEGNKDRLLDLASSTLSTKTIADLERPGARNLIRAELISVFNSALGGGLVREIYFTEFAIQ